jgi:hypothetical protein
MSYATAEAGLLTLIRAMSDYDSASATAGDYRPLGKGKSQVVVLNAGPVPNRRVVQATRRIATDWVIYIDLYVAWRGEISTIATDIRSKRQDIIDHIDKYPTLNNTSGVLNAFISGGGEPQAWRGGSKNWWHQRLRCDIQDRVTITIAE